MSDQLEIGFDEVEDEALDGVEESIGEIVDDMVDRTVDNLEWFETVLTISEGLHLYEEGVNRDIGHMEIGEGALFAQIFVEEGEEAFMRWRGEPDETHKYFSPDYNSIKGAWAMVPYSVKVEETNNPELQRRFRDIYSFEVDMSDGTMGCNLVRPQERNYDWMEARPVNVGDTKIIVPSLYSMIASKMRVLRGEGDRKDAMNLLYVAEERGISPEELRKDIYGRDSQLGGKMEDFVVNEEHGEIREAVEYSPSEEYVEELASQLARSNPEN